MGPGVIENIFPAAMGFQIAGHGPGELARFVKQENVLRQPACLSADRAAFFQRGQKVVAEEGIGAKTNSGYGRMMLEGYTPTTHAASQPRETYELAKLRLLKQETPPPGRYRGEVVEVKGRYGFINPARGGAKVFAFLF